MNKAYLQFEEKKFLNDFALSHFAWFQDVNFPMNWLSRIIRAQADDVNSFLSESIYIKLFYSYEFIASVFNTQFPWFISQVNCVF